MYNIGKIICQIFIRELEEITCHSFATILCTDEIYQRTVWQMAELCSSARFLSSHQSSFSIPCSENYP